MRDKLTTTLYTVLRVGAGLLFMQHGAQKLFGWLGGHGPVELMSMMGVAGVVEFFGGLLMVLGLLVTPVGAIMAIQMVVAHFMAHQPRGGLPVENGGELALLYALVFGYLAARGAGPVSVDARISAARGR